MKGRHGAKKDASEGNVAKKDGKNTISKGHTAEGKSGEKKRRGKFARAKIVLPCFGAAAVGVLAVVNYFFPFFNRVSAFIIPSYQAGDLRIHFVDVGQGDCAMLELPDGKFMIIDGGEKSEQTTVYNYARSLGMEKVDHLVVSHTDSDHSGGLALLTQEMEIGTAYLPFAPYASSASNAYSAVYENIQKNASAIYYSARYDVIDGGDAGYYMVFLSPHAETAYNGELPSSNDSSAVIWLDYYGTDALFTGDISSSVEKWLLDEWSLDQTIFDGERAVQLDSTEILKVAHHGSQYSSSAEWLELLNFQTAVISCGAGNSYGHPRQETLERLSATTPAAKIYRTDELGSIIITMHSDGTYDVAWSKKLSSSALSAEIIELEYIPEDRHRR